MSLKAVIVDDRIGQVVSEIIRDVLLDQRAVVHELLKVQDVYRGVALSYVLLNQAFPLYRRSVSTGAGPCGDGDRALALAGLASTSGARRSHDRDGGALAALGGLGKAASRPERARRRLAQLGSGSPQGPRTWSRCASPFRHRSRPGERTGDEAERRCDGRRMGPGSGAETGGQFDCSMRIERGSLSPGPAAGERRDRARQGDHAHRARLVGVFDLDDQATADAFDASSAGASPADHRWW